MSVAMLGAPALTQVAAAMPAVHRSQAAVAKRAYAARAQHQRDRARAQRGLALIREAQRVGVRGGRSVHKVVTRRNGTTFSVTATPNAMLRPGQTVSIDGVGFSVNGSMFVTECAVDAGNGFADCDLSTDRLPVVDQAGDFTVLMTANRHILLSSGAIYDCGQAINACNFSWVNLNATSENGNTPIDFDPNAVVNAAITATPSTKLVHLQPVQINGSGFAPNDFVQVTECPLGLEPLLCGHTARAFEMVGSDGSFSDSIAVRRVVQGPGGNVDCATSPCELVAQGSGGLDFEARTSISFDPNGPVPPPLTMTVTPNTGLLNRQLVTVAGTGFDPNEEAQVVECSGTGSDPNGACVFSNVGDITADGSGNVSVQLPVKRLIAGPNGLIDCATAACSLTLQSFQSDAFLTAPISFDSSVPPPPLPTITATPSTGLLDRQTVTVDGINFDPFVAVNIYECDALGDCRDLADQISTDNVGNLNYAVTVTRLLHSFETSSSIDCADATNACHLVADDGNGSTGMVAIAFDGYVPPPPPEVVEISPKRALKDHQLVTVRGRGLFPGDELDVSECATDPTSGSSCSGFGTTVDANGTFVITVRIDRQMEIFEGPAGKRASLATSFIDCVDPGVTCELQIDDFNDGSNFTLPLQFDPGAPLAAPPVMTATPSIGLHAKQEIALHGSGFAPGSRVPLLQCGSTSVGVDFSGCRAVADQIADSAGAFDARVKVLRRIVTFGGTFDCAIVTTCAMLALDLSSFSITPGAAVAPIMFDPSSPILLPKLIVTPHQHLRDGKIVSVKGSGFTPNADVGIVECPTAGPGLEACDFIESVLIHADSHGRVDTTFAISNALIDNGFFDCTAPSGACSLLVSNARDFSESNTVPLLFDPLAATGANSRSARSRRIAARTTQGHARSRWR